MRRANGSAATSTPTSPFIPTATLFGPKPGKVRHEEIRFSGDRPALTHTLLWMDGKGTPLIQDVRSLEVGLDGKGFPVLDWHFHFSF